MTAPAALVSSTFDDSRTETVFVAEVLKGDLEPRAKLQVQLRRLKLLSDDDFRMGRSYVLFLRQDHTGLYLVNVSGSALPVAVYRKSTRSYDGDVRGYIALLLNDLVSERKDRAVVVEKQALSAGVGRWARIYAPVTRSAAGLPGF